jgi:hypothetical protein
LEEGKYIYAYDTWMTTNGFVLVVVISFLQNTIVQGATMLYKLATAH